MTYDAQFFADIADDARNSAAVIVPKFFDLVKPDSVVDVGCGKGHFLTVFAELGVEDYLGLDGGPAEDLAIPAEHYQQVDLAQPLDVGRTFDLALCLEVAEHLPESAAEMFVAQLCALAPVVLFSAAIPMQGGNGHLNERWPDYWNAIFTRNSFRGTGWPRVDIWDDERISIWYRQNLLLFVHQGHPSWDLRNYVDSSPAFSMYRLVHPGLFGQKLGVSFQ